jgi:hypothetical protein
MLPGAFRDNVAAVIVKLVDFLIATLHNVVVVVAVLVPTARLR